MLKLLNGILRNSHNIAKAQKPTQSYLQCRSFLSQAYYCNEVWEQRFKDPLLQKINLDELYNELEQRYQKHKNISAVDVDIFTNAVKDDIYADEVLDLVHKLRMSSDSSNTLTSTLHATLRNFINFGKTDQLLNALDDRLNYGLFLDDYTANLLLDTFWKKKDYMSGARVASQLMLQEDFEHPLCASLSLLHCYNFLLNPSEWPQPSQPEEPEEEVKIRINYLRNPYDDNHFDLRDPYKIIGKSMMMITKKLNNTLEKSLHLVGLALFDPDAAKQFLEKLAKNSEKVYEDALKLIPDDNVLKSEFKVLQTESIDIQQLLQDSVRSAEQSVAEKDVALQCENFLKWEKERDEAIQKQQKRLLTLKRLANIEESQKSLKEKEMLLWYFENEEKIELEIEEKQAQLVQNKEKKKIVTKTDENYVPPEIQKKYA